eukprot:GGOE01018195.1.p2 GENE.GGOE01018195.1~~GGOE01018195.1.p2  ORF type:complete len:232 (-),score=43.13 GGOE01018195.1:19-714(-)
MGCCNCSETVVQQITWANAVGPRGAWPTWTAAGVVDPTSASNAPGTPPPAARRWTSNVAELEQQYNELKAQYACSPRARKAQLQEFLGLLNANPAWQPAAWSTAATAARHLPSLWRFDDNDGMPDFDRHMLTLLNIVVPGRYPFETLEVVSAAGEEAGESDDGKPEALSASQKDSPDLCHYCVDVPPSVEYVCCGHRAACFECFLKMSVLDTRCPHCRASEPGVRTQKPPP